MEPEMRSAAHASNHLNGPSRRALMTFPLALLAALADCATSGTPDVTSGVVSTGFADPLPRSGAQTILIAMPTLGDFVDVRRGLVTEVQKNFNVTTLAVSDKTTAAELGAVIERTSPACVVLMNNPTVALFRQYKDSRGSNPVPPAVVVMTTFLERLRATLPHSTGIAYEVPGVTMVRNLRTIIAAPVHKVGVIYRPLFKDFVEKQKGLAASEQIEFVGAEVAKDINAEDLKAAIVALATKNKVDALWMVNDNGLIRDGRFLDESWRAALKEVKVPLIVGLSNLVDPIAPLGTLAVVPDHETMGLQAANLIFDVADDGWRVEDHAIELPLSVKTIVDVKQAREQFGLQPDALRHIDRVAE
jgi:putative ABC transport system substrate-binding protein